MQFKPRELVFLFQISLSSILIAGGLNGHGELKDCYSFETANNTVERVSDLPEEDIFTTPYALVVYNDLYVVGYESEAILKYSMAGGEWETVLKF